MTEFKFIVPDSHPTLAFQSMENWKWLEKDLTRHFGGWYCVNGRGSWQGEPQVVRIYHVASEWAPEAIQRYLDEVRAVFRQATLYTTVGSPHGVTLIGENNGNSYTDK